jgi:hypothetical protein
LSAVKVLHDAQARRSGDACWIDAAGARAISDRAECKQRSVLGGEDIGSGGFP